MNEKTKKTDGFDFEIEPIQALDIEEILKEQNAAKKRLREEDQDRIKQKKCPSCGSTNKKHVVKSDNNGVLGIGYHSWVTDDYFYCLDCGVMYKDIVK